MNFSLSRILPIAGWLPHYDPAWLRSDLLAGVAIWALVVPQSMAYAQLAGLPPQAGIFVSFSAPLAYALFGTSRQLICGPSSSTAAISAVHVAPLVASDPAEFAAMSAMLAIICGIIFLLLGLFRLGFISQFIASPVQTGFLFGLGMTIIAGQLFTLFGITSESGPFYRQLWHFATHLGEINGWTVAFGAGSLIVLLIVQRVAPGIPATLGVVAFSIALVWLLGLSDRDIALIGNIESTLPAPVLPAISPDALAALIPAAAAIVMVSYSESTTIARRFAGEHHYEIRPNQELIALGVSGIASGIFQGFVTSGGASQSAANDRAGAKTQVSSLVLSALAVLTAIALLPLIARLPLAVLGAIVINAVLGFINVPAMQRIWRVRRQSFALALVALVSVLVLGILAGLLIAIFLSLLHLLMQLSRPYASEIGTLPGTSQFVELHRRPDAVTRPGLLAFRLEGPLLFINATWVRDALKAHIAGAATPPRVILLDLAETTALDFTSFDMLANLRNELASEDGGLWLTNVRDGVREILDRDRATSDGDAWIFATNAEAGTAFDRLPLAPSPQASNGDRTHSGDPP